MENNFGLFPGHEPTVRAEGMHEGQAKLFSAEMCFCGHGIAMYLLAISIPHLTPPLLL